MGVSTTMDEQVIFDTGIGVLPMGTRADHITESGTYVGLIADGEMTVSGEAGAYSVECSFLTAEGRSVTCSWNGDVTGHGDGTCTFEFSFLDDKGNTWDGKWTGTLSVRSSSGIKQMTLF